MITYKHMCGRVERVFLFLLQGYLRSVAAREEYLRFRWVCGEKSQLLNARVEVVLLEGRAGLHVF